MSGQALFPGLLGTHFQALDECVRAVHRGSSGRWQGTASVQRGSGWILRLAAGLVGLPASIERTPTTVNIDVRTDREVWTRQFGDSRRMRSTLYASGGLLVERLGPVALQFRILPRDQGMLWELQRIHVMGLPLARRWFQIDARSVPCERGYGFSVTVRIAGLGELIHYEGQLSVPRD